MSYLACFLLIILIIVIIVIIVGAVTKWTFRSDKFTNQSACNNNEYLHYGYCYPNTPTDYSMPCPSDFVYNASDNTCKKTQTKNYTYSCPSGGSLSGTTCTENQLKTCSYSKTWGGVNTKYNGYWYKPEGHNQWKCMFDKTSWNSGGSTSWGRKGKIAYSWDDSAASWEKLGKYGGAEVPVRGCAAIFNEPPRIWYDSLRSENNSCTDYNVIPPNNLTSSNPACPSKGGKTLTQTDVSSTGSDKGHFRNCKYTYGATKNYSCSENQTLTHQGSNYTCTETTQPLDIFGCPNDYPIFDTYTCARSICGSNQVYNPSTQNCELIV